MEDGTCLCSVGSFQGCWCCQQLQVPAGAAVANSKPAPAEKHMEEDAAEESCAGSRGNASQMPLSPPSHCSLQDLPVEMLVEIFAWVPGTDLPSLAQACTRFHNILHIDSIWRRRCQVEYGACENLHLLEVMGMSWREVYTKLLHPYGNILGLWQLDSEPIRELLNVALDGLCITGWKYLPPHNLEVDGPMQFKPSFRIRLSERKSAMVECLEGYSRPHSCHIQIQKHQFTTKCNWTDHHRRSRGITNNLSKGLSEEMELVLKNKLMFSCHHSDCLTYHRIYFPPSHPDNLIRPGLFKGTNDADRLKVAMLSFHGKYARATKITGDPFIPAWKQMLEIHLMHRIQPPNVKILGNFNKLSLIFQEIHQQVILEQQEEEERPEDSEGHGWQRPAQPSFWESGAAVLEEQPAHTFVLPEGVSSRDQNYPGTYRMCFYAVHKVTYYGYTYHQRFPGIFFLFDENHFGFLCLELKSFIVYSRVQDTFQNVEAPSPQAFLEMLEHLVCTPGWTILHAL